MKRSLLYILLIWAAFLAIFVVLKVAFMAIEPAYAPLKLSSVFSVIGHGFSMDMAVASYLTVIPLLFLIISIINNPWWLKRAMNWYFGVVGGLIAVIYVVDAVLYPYWGFRLDMTPIFYMTSSPTAAMASSEWWMLIFGLGAIIIIADLVYMLFKHINVIIDEWNMSRKHKIKTVSMLIVCAGLLFLGIRGGLTVSTMNPSRAYFSTNLKLNHAAMNPMFTLLYSATHQGNFDEQFRYMDNEEANRRVLELYPRVAAAPKIPVDTLPDVYIIMLESFSSHLLPAQGGEPIAMCLDSIAREGILFTNAYASSFRTDRGLTSIYSAYPAPPTTSLLKYVDKLENIESIPRSMEHNGYESEYYYGGDINFTNVNAYLRAAGVGKVISDKDFPMSQRLSKWGAHDGPLFDKVIEEIENSHSDCPTLRMIQTSSSHEPFEVPFEGSDNKRINSFMYADAELGRFIGWLKDTGRWQNSIVVITPDHYGAYPQQLEGAVARHHIPIVFTGGAIVNSALMDMKEEAAQPMSQNDIAATLLAILGFDYSDFPYSNDALRSGREGFAFVTEPSFAALITSDRVTSISTESDTMLEGDNAEDARKIKAMLQVLYNDLDAR